MFIYNQLRLIKVGVIDSLVVTTGSSNVHWVIFFQITISENHPMGAASLTKIWDVLPDEGYVGGVWGDVGVGCDREGVFLQCASE